MTTQTDLRGILARAISDIEAKPTIQFSDKEWQIINRLEREIHEWERNINLDMPIREEIAVWNALTDYQRRLLDLAQNKYGTSILEYEEEELRLAHELETRDYVTIKHPAQTDSRYVICFITIKGRQLLSVNKGVARA